MCIESYFFLILKQCSHRIRVSQVWFWKQNQWCTSQHQHASCCCSASFLETVVTHGSVWMLNGRAICLVGNGSGVLQACATVEVSGQSWRSSSGAHARGHFPAAVHGRQELSGLVILGRCKSHVQYSDSVYNILYKSFGIPWTCKHNTMLYNQIIFGVIFSVVVLAETSLGSPWNWSISLSKMTPYSYPNKRKWHVMKVHNFLGDLTDAFTKVYALVCILLKRWTLSSLLPIELRVNQIKHFA